MPRWTRGQLLLAAAFTVACGPTAKEAEPVSVAPPSAGTRWVHPIPAAESGFLEAPAQVIASPNDTAQISAPLSARVLRIRVHPGQHVERGEVLVDVVMPELIRAAGALRSADLRLESWQERREIVAPLVNKRLAPAAELSELNANIAAVRSDRENARAVLRAAGESDKRVDALLSGDGSISLRAPFAGVVVAVTAMVGEVREPTAGPLVELITEDADPRVQARFTSTPPAGSRFVWVESSRRVPLTLERLSPHADERDGSRRGWLRVAQESGGLVAGTLGRVQILAPEEWVVVPARALRTRDGHTTVEIKAQEGSQSVQVTVLQKSDSEAVITGVTPEARVAADVSLLDALQ